MGIDKSDIDNVVSEVTQKTKQMNEMTVEINKQLTAKVEGLQQEILVTKGLGKDLDELKGELMESINQIKNWDENLDEKDKKLISKFHGRDREKTWSGYKISHEI